MAKKQAFQLIEGEFTPQEAKEVLTNLYNSKINFHKLKNFSSTERFGIPDETAGKRIQALKESLSHISDIIEEAAEQKKHLVIAATINIEPVNVKK